MKCCCCWRQIRSESVIRRRPDDDNWMLDGEGINSNNRTRIHPQTNQGAATAVRAPSKARTGHDSAEFVLLCSHLNCVPPMDTAVLATRMMCGIKNNKNVCSPLPRPMEDKTPRITQYNAKDPSCMRTNRWQRAGIVSVRLMWLANRRLPANGPRNCTDGQSSERRAFGIVMQQIEHFLAIFT